MLTPGNLHRILEADEHAVLGAFVGIHRQQVARAQVQLVGHAAFGHLVRRVAGDHPRQGALAGAVGPHDGVHLAGVHFQVDAAQDRDPAAIVRHHGGAQVADLDHQPTLPSSFLSSSLTASTENSSGSFLNTSLQKPLISNEIAASMSSPRVAR